MSRKWLSLLLVVLLLVGIASAAKGDTNNYADNPKNDTHLSQPPKNLVVIEKHTPIILEPPLMKRVSITYSDYVPDDLITQITKAIGKLNPFDKKPKDITETASIEETSPGKKHKVASIEGVKIAIIPEDSKFISLDLHEACLPLQYGTDEWYACEVKYEGK